MPLQPIVIKEHQTYDIEKHPDGKKCLEERHVVLEGMPTDFMGIPKYLGVDNSLTAGFYIGADWLVEKELPIVVLPKIDNLDYLGMFVAALSVDSVAESNYFAKCYGISFNKPAIEVSEDVSQLTPLLLVHYITLLEKLVKTGLRKGYVTISENLTNRYKGHLLVSQHIKKNIIFGRQDRNYCSYQVFSSDIPVNRLLKKALLFAQKMLQNLLPVNRMTMQLQNRINALLSAFADVSDNIEISEVRLCSGNKIFKNYAQAVVVAKDILRRYDYSIANIDESNHSTPCFWIDMSRMFELYVYSKLSTAYPGKIKFQVRGYCGTAADYIHVGEHIIIDAKYKPRYEYSNSGIIPDIREISGYGRDVSILEHFGKDFLNSNEEVKCLIIYPQTEVSFPISDGSDEQMCRALSDYANMNELQQSSTPNPLWNQATEIKYYRNFRKLRISLPIINH